MFVALRALLILHIDKIHKNKTHFAHTCIRRNPEVKIVNEATDVCQYTRLLPRLVGCNSYTDSMQIQRKSSLSPVRKRFLSHINSLFLLVIVFTNVEENAGKAQLWCEL